MEDLALIDKHFFHIPQGSEVTHYEAISKEIFDLRVYDFYFSPVVNSKVVIDVGANIGMFTYYSCCLFNRTISIEPALNCLPSLYKNIYMYSLDALVVEKGAWSSKGVLNFYEMDNAPGGNTIQYKSDKTHKIEVSTVDIIVKELELNEVGFIKMDIEGSEPEALKGSIETIKKFHPKMALCTYHKPNDEQDMINFITSLGNYQIVAINFVSNSSLGPKLIYCF